MNIIGGSRFNLKILWGVMSLGVLAACSTAPLKNTSSHEGEQSFSQSKPGSLSYEEAALRTKQIARPTYTLWFGFDKTTKTNPGETFEGRAVLNFELRAKAKNLSKTLFIDFEGGTLRSLTVNGALQKTPQYDGHRIWLQTEELLAGSNRIEIAFNHPYSHDGSGLIRFEDPVDHETYLYSHFEPFNAHRMFPCFDQPDLKASFELTVETPSEWEVISNTQEREVTELDERESWAFPPTPLLSPYVFALHSGPYHVWKSNANGIPLRLFARESLAQHVNAEEWFDVTQKGLDYFSVFFGYPYPYSKYDQVIAPEFNQGGMENAGAVTLSENTIFRTHVTADQLRGRANLILHEMAHMWFGDLITMRWWNGLWLNESFASYMASRAIEQATSFGGTRQSFFNGLKKRAYQEDQLVTTHPVEVPVPDTESATAQFDAITYGKGASVLKQLNFYLGDDDFREGIQRYFQKYALRNTTINDFMSMLSEASGKNLTSWQKVWLETPGLNTLQAQWTCKTTEEGSVIDHFTLLQGYEENQSPVLRPHRTQVALYDFPKKRLKSEPQNILVPYATVDVTYKDQQTQVSELLGKQCPNFVFPNHEDHDYVKVILDPISLESIQKNLMKIQDSFPRQMIWESLWQMVVDGQFSALNFGKLVLTYGTLEKDTQILSSLLKTLFNTYAGAPSVYKFLPPETRKQFRPLIEDFYQNNLQLAPAGSDLQLVWYQSFISVASSPKSQEFILNILKGKDRLAGLKIDQERRWEVIQALARNGLPSIREIISAEKKIDPTDSGIQSAIGSEVSIPDQISKKTWLEKILQSSTNSTEGDNLSFAKAREAMWRFHVIDQENLSRLSMNLYFETLPKLTSPSLREFGQSFTAAMFPVVCDEEVIKRTTAFLDHHSELPVPLVKTLKMHRQREEQCVRARQVVFNSNMTGQ